MNNYALLLMINLLAVAFARADSSPETEAFLEVKDAVWSPERGDFQQFPLESLPEAIQVSVKESHAILKSESITVMSIARDLNGDGQPEYFINNLLGGSGGPGFDIWAKRDGKWVTIGNLQGGFYLLTPKEGWMPIVCFTRGGPNSYYKGWLEFSEGQYRTVQAVRIDDGKPAPVKFQPPQATLPDAPGELSFTPRLAEEFGRVVVIRARLMSDEEKRKEFGTKSAERQYWLEVFAIDDTTLDEPVHILLALPWGQRMDVEGLRRLHRDHEGNLKLVGYETLREDGPLLQSRQQIILSDGTTFDNAVPAGTAFRFVQVFVPVERGVQEQIRRDAKSQNIPNAK